MPVVLPPPKWVLNPSTKMTFGRVFHILASFSWTSVLGVRTVVFPGWRTSVTICFCWSSLSVITLLIWMVTVSFMMAADLQAAREGSVLWGMFRSGIAGSCSNFTFNILRNCQTVSHLSWTVLHSTSYVQWFKFLHIPANSCCFPFFFFFLIIAS